MANTKTTKPYVRIQSSMNIQVTCGLTCQDVTRYDSDIPDRFKINPLWPKANVLVKQGAHWYPSEIAEWNTVKALVEQGVLTIGEYSDTADDEVVKQKETLARVSKEFEKKTGKSLNDLTE